MTEHPRSVEPPGLQKTSNVVGQRETLGSLSMRSPRGFVGSIVLVLALPIAVLAQVLLGSGSSLSMHVMLTVGCTLIALSAFDFGTPRWVAWVGRAAAGAFDAIFVLQGASELVRTAVTRTPKRRSSE